LVSRHARARRSRDDGPFDKFARLQRLSAPVVVVRSSATSAAKVVWSAVPRTASADRQAVLQRRDLERGAFLPGTARRGSDAAAGSESPAAVERPGIHAAPLRLLSGFFAIVMASLAALHEFDAAYGTNVAVPCQNAKYEAYFVIDPAAGAGRATNQSSGEETEPCP
jgi:hypothetical protein